MSPRHRISLVIRTRYKHLQKIPAARKILIFGEEGQTAVPKVMNPHRARIQICLLYTSDAADE